MIQYHYSEKVGDFTVCKAPPGECPLGNTTHLVVSDDMTVKEFNKLKEEYFEARADGVFGNTMSKSRDAGGSDVAVSSTSASAFNPDEVNIAEYKIAIDNTTHISDLVKEGSVVVFKGKPYEVKDYSFDKFTGDIELETSDGSKITVNENRPNSLRFSAVNMLQNGLNPFRYAYSDSDYESVTKLRAGDMYSINGRSFTDENARIVTEVEERNSYEDVTVHSVDRNGDSFVEKVDKMENVWVVRDDLFNNDPSSQLYVSERFMPAANSLDSKDDA